jgi:hypothetical protein
MGLLMGLKRKIAKKTVTASVEGITKAKDNGTDGLMRFKRI